MDANELPEGAVSVSVRDVSLSYPVEVTMPPGAGARRFLPTRRRRSRVAALRNVSFDVREGEHVGIVGANGSGKSTLLRAIAGVEPVDSGQVLAVATPVLLGVNAALLPHLTGERNIRLGLLALGYSPEEAQRRHAAVVQLAGIGEAIHRPMRTYSSGMSARLTFSIAASADPTILLIDEALGTGDLAFAERSREAMDQLRSRAGTIFLVSHAAQTIETMCTRAIWLHRGEKILDGEAVPVARAYRWWAWNVTQEKHEVANQLLAAAMAGHPVSD